MAYVGICRIRQVSSKITKVLAWYVNSNVVGKSTHCFLYRYYFLYTVGDIFH